jgi:hypothetical protein
VHTFSAIRRWVFGFLVGGAVTTLPWLVSRLDYEVLWPVNFVMIPGGVVALILSGGNVQTYSLPVLVTANVILYATATYLVLRARGSQTRNESARLTLKEPHD